MATIPDKEPYIQDITPDWYQGKVAKLSMLRLDVVHPDVSGNKWYKLKYNLQYCLGHKLNGVLTFGGAYSNHLAATAAAAHAYKLKSIAIVKGTYAAEQLTPTLQFCKAHGMELIFVAHETYKQKNDADYLHELSLKYPDMHIVPEGGANEEGRSGAGEICSYISGEYNYVALSVGTGTTLTGIVNALPDDRKILGFAPMKRGAYLQDELKTYIHSGKQDSYRIYDNWHFGGFGKHNSELLDFMNSFYTAQHIPLDVVYTSKMMFGIRELIHRSEWGSDSKILCIHTGGLQGNASVKDRLVY